ncbi:MAG: fimbria/pilus periplasmic chaperone [Burkholderiaceae bacterium]
MRAATLLRSAAACMLALAGACAFAQGSPFAVAPVTFKLDTATEFGAVEVSNRGEEPMGVEATLVRVRLVEGKETYEPADEFTFSPPTFRLQAGKSRLVRFRYSGPRGATEGVYRLFLRQLPEATGSQQIAMVFNIGVPIFVAPSTASPSLAIVKNGPAPRMENTGNVTVTVSQLEGCAAATEKILVRLFPGQATDLKEAQACATSAKTERGNIAIAVR